jgi:ABC-type Mn2+/Zn2+ transport system ATPase subunit
MIRRARTEDDERWLERAKFERGLQKVVINSEVILDFEDSSLAIVGKNGSRKTQFVRSIHNLNHGEDSNRPKFLSKSPQFDDMEILLSPQGFDRVNLFFDPCTLIPSLDQKLNLDTNIDDFREASGYRDADATDLQWISFLTGNTYESIKIYSVEDAYEDFPKFPLFDVVRSGICYSSTGLGYGEHSLLYCYWLIGMAQKLAEDGKSVVLTLEEPESFISPFFQQRLMSFVVNQSRKSKIQLIVVSHSEHIISKFSKSRVVAARWDRCSGDFHFDSIDSHKELARELGIVKRYNQVLFVEDECAQIFLQEILSDYEDGVFEDLLVVRGKDGESSVKKLQEHIASQAKDFRFKFVFDADCQIAEENDLILPGSLAPENEIIKWLNGLDEENLVNLFDAPPQQARVVIDRHVGSDHHDFLLNISRDIGVSYCDFFRRLCRNWVRDANNKSVIMSFYQNLSKPE